jgi:drug/metabolite transporter (DMT)-like permease
MSFYNNLLALPLLLTVLFVQGEHLVAAERLQAVTLGGWAWIFITCILGFLISTSGFGLQKLVSATTFLVVNNAAKTINILLGMFVLGDKMSGTLQASGSILSILASAWYSVAVSRHQQGKAKAAKK